MGELLDQLDRAASRRDRGDEGCTNIVRPCACSSCELGAERHDEADGLADVEAATGRAARLHLGAERAGGMDIPAGKGVSRG